MEIKTFTFKEKLKHLFCLPVIVAALGYFVDIYDLLLFGIVRVPSLESMNRGTKSRRMKNWMARTWV